MFWAFNVAPEVSPVFGSDWPTSSLAPEPALYKQELSQLGWCAVVVHRLAWSPGTPQSPARRLGLEPASISMVFI